VKKKQLALSVLSTALVASMAASAFAAAPKAGVYIGGNVDKYYSFEAMGLNMDTFLDEMIDTVPDVLYVSKDGEAKGGNLAQLLFVSNPKSHFVDVTDEMFADIDGADGFNAVNEDGTVEAVKRNPDGTEVPDTPGELKVESVSAITKTKVEVKFSKAVDSVTVENFSIAGATVNTAKLGDDKKTVALTVSGLKYQTEYTLASKGILVDGKPVDLTDAKFSTPAVTDLYNLELTTDAPNDQILANGADNLVITAKLIDKVTGKVDENADNVLVSFNATRGSLANDRVTVQNGVANVTLTSEFSEKDITSKIDAQIIEASGDYKDLIGEVIGTKTVHFKVKLDDIDPDQKPALVGAESNQADRVVLNFNKAVTPADFVQVNEVTGKYKVDNNGNAVLIDTKVAGLGLVDVSQEGGAPKAIRGFKPVDGNPNAIAVILQKDQNLVDNKAVKVVVNMPSNIGIQTTEQNFILTDARKPEATSATNQNLKTVVVKFSEAIAKVENVSLDGGLTEIDQPKTVFGDFDQVTLEDKRDQLTIVTKEYLTSGTHSVQLSKITDFAGLTDKNNISTSQTLDFVVSEDNSVPTAEVSVESPEQFRVTFNKLVEGFDSATDDFKLQKFVKGQNGAADEWKNVEELDWINDINNKAPKLTITPIEDTAEYVLELEDDWTHYYDTNATNKNYYNDQYRLFIPKEAVTNPANGKKNADIILPLNYSGSKLNSADTKSPVIAGFEPIIDSIMDNFNVKMSEPVKLPEKDKNNTPSQIQGTVPQPIIEFLGKDKDGNAVTIKGQVVDYTSKNGDDTSFEVTPAADQPSLQAIVNAGGDKKWTLVVRSISDDVGNTAASLTYDFVVEPEQQASEVFMVEGLLPSKENWHGVDGYDNGNDKDTIVLHFTSGVQYTGDVKNAVNPANYLLNGKKLHDDVLITVSDSDGNKDNGYDMVIITLPDGNLKISDSNVITLNKSLESYKGVKLSGKYEVEFKVGDSQSVATVDALIAKLPAADKLTLADASQVLAAKTAFDNLSADQQALVTNAATLAVAVDVIKGFQANDLISKLRAVDTLTLADEVAVTKAKEAYEALGADGQPKVTAANKQKLDDAVAKIEQLKAEAGASEAVQKVVAQIDALPAADQLTTTHIAAIEKLVADFDLLSQAQQEQIASGKITKYNAIKAQLQGLKDIVAAKEALTTTITAAQKAHDDAKEGTAVGEYAVGSKATLKSAIDAAQAVADKANATKAELDQAKSDLDGAVTTFENGKVTAPAPNTDPTIAFVSGVGNENVNIGDTVTAPSSSDVDVADAEDDAAGTALSVDIVIKKADGTAVTTIDTSAAETYTVTYTVTDSEGATASVNRTITIS